MCGDRKETDAHFQRAWVLYPHPLTILLLLSLEKESRYYFIQSGSFVNSKTTFCFAVAHDIEISELKETVIRESRGALKTAIFIQYMAGLPLESFHVMPIV